MQTTAPGAHTPLERLAHALPRAAVLALLSAAAAWPAFRILAPRLAVALPPGIRVDDVVTMQVLRTTLAAFLCATIGLVWAERAGLPALGRRPPLRHALALLLAGCAGGALSAIAFDRAFARVVPGLYPRTVFEAVVLFPMNPLVDEIIGRMGFFTLIAGLTGRPRASIALQAVLMTLLTVFPQARLTGHAFEPPELFAVGAALSLGFHAALAWAYGRYGLAGAVCLHAGLQTKLFLLRLPPQPF